MNLKDLRTLHLLEEIEKNDSPSQRQLAIHLNVSLGLINSFVKRLSNKGFFKVTHIPKNRVKYLLTPEGVAEKTRLTYEFIKYSYGFYRDAREKLNKLFQELHRQGVKKIIFVGATELAEIAFITLYEAELELVAVLDDDKIGRKFFKHIVGATDCLSTISFDRIIITATDSLERHVKMLHTREIDDKRIVFIQ